MQVEFGAKRMAEPGRAHPAPFPLTRTTEPETAARPEWNVRTVGLVAKPERAQHLAACIEGPVTDLLRQMPGFGGLIVLHSGSDGRNLLVLTFWETEKQAATSCWEEVSSVRNTLSSMVDVYTRVQTFRAATSAAPRGSVSREVEGARRAGTVSHSARV